MRRNARGYLLRAFNFTRQFKYQWTVNWRFVPEDVFLSREFAISLLILHCSLLLLFLTTRWIRPSRKSPRDFFKMLYIAPPEAERNAMAARITPDFILTSILTANAIGMLCARSLHYQFFSWLAWATPWLLLVADLPPLLSYLVWLGQEVAWNQYPSTELSSKIVVGVLAAIVVRVWVATDEAPDSRASISAAADQIAREQRRRIPRTRDGQTTSHAHAGLEDLQSS